jgi:hypothetical protein
MSREFPERQINYHFLAQDASPQPVVCKTPDDGINRSEICTDWKNFFRESRKLSSCVIGLSEEQAADVLRLSPRTIRRD